MAAESAGGELGMAWASAISGSLGSIWGCCLSTGWPAWDLLACSELAAGDVHGRWCGGLGPWPAGGGYK